MATDRQRRHTAYAAETHAAIRADEPETVPEGWHAIWRERDRRDHRRKRVTVELDAEVVAFFKAMGAGYGPRMNRVLRAYMHDRLSRRVAGPEDTATEAEVARVKERDMEIAAARRRVELKRMRF